MPVNEQNLSNEILATRAKEGDRSAFNILVRKYHKPMINFVYRTINDLTRAEELAQEIFVRCYLNINNFDPRYKFATWLYTIATNFCKNEIRDRIKRPKSVALQDSTRAYDAKPASPVDILAAKERQKKISEAIETLPEDQRMAIIMSTYDGLPYKEIARILKTTENTVKSWVYRGKQQLFDNLKQCMDKEKYE